MKILALDLGTDTGYAAGNTEGGEFTMGTWKLATAKEVREWGKQRLTRRRDPRPKRLCNFINSRILSSWVPDLIVFEDVQFSSSTYQTQLWASLRAGVWMCFSDCIKFDCLPVQSLKKLACHGGADKAAMRESLKNKHPEKYRSQMTDDEVDAVWLWVWAKATYRA